MFSLKNKIESYYFFKMDTGLWQKPKFVAAIDFKICTTYLVLNSITNFKQ